MEKLSYNSQDMARIDCRTDHELFIYMFQPKIHHFQGEYQTWFQSSVLTDDQLKINMKRGCQKARNKSKQDRCQNRKWKLPQIEVKAK